MARSTSRSRDIPRQIRVGLRGRLAVADVARLDLDDLLRRTDAAELAGVERLRRLARYLEPACTGPGIQPRGWRALDRIYRRALALPVIPTWSPARPGRLRIQGHLLGSDRDRIVATPHLSRALSALACAATLGDGRAGPDSDDHIRRRILAEGHAAAGMARKLDSLWPEARAALGQMCYFDPDRDVEDAHDHYRSALEYDPGHGWARLYQAHCLHDLERWQPADDAYAAAPDDFLAGLPRWRYDLYLEKRAWCLLRAGHTHRALAHFQDLLARHEASISAERLEHLLDAPGLTRVQRLIIRTTTERYAVAGALASVALAERPWPLTELLIGPRPLPTRCGEPSGLSGIGWADIERFMASYPRLHLVSLADSVVPLPDRLADQPSWPMIDGEGATAPREDRVARLTALVGQDPGPEGITAIGRAMWARQPAVRAAALAAAATLARRGNPLLYSLRRQLDPGLVDDPIATIACLARLGRHARPVLPALRGIAAGETGHLDATRDAAAQAIRAITAAD